MGIGVWPLANAASIIRLSLLWWFSASVAFASAAASAQELHRLTEKGATLGIYYIDNKVDDLRLKINLGGDIPVSTHVYAKIGGSELRQRTNEGYWIPWNGNMAALIDNKFPTNGQEIEYKILDQDLGSDNQGITIVIGYRTPATFKFGNLALLPKQGER